MLNEKQGHIASLVIPMNWEEDYFDKIDFSSTSEIYGKQNIEFIGGGRPAFSMPSVSKKKIGEFVKEAHSRNLKFNYLLNATCIDNLELSRHGYHEIRKILDWLSSVQVDTITVTLPFLLEVIKKHYPDFKVSVSVQARIDCVEQALYWEEMGADKLNISYVDLNKNFSELKRISKQVKCKIQTLVNVPCMNHCPFVTLHGNYNAHNSQSYHVMDNFCMVYYEMNCYHKLYSNPVEILKSAIIRPEDLHWYEEAGIHYFKLVERNMTTDALAKIVKAYTQRKHDGNLFDLLPTISKFLFYEKKGQLFRKLKYILQPFKANLFKLKKMADEYNSLRATKEFRESFDIYIDNKKLNGFMDFFYDGKCHRNCSKCSHCSEFAAKAIKLLVSGQQHFESMSIFSNSRQSLINGDVFQ